MFQVDTGVTWVNSNTFPHSTFNWVGIDGTQVLCHMTPVGMSLVIVAAKCYA